MGKWSEIPAGDLRKFENEFLSALGDDASEIVGAVKDEPSLAQKAADHLRALVAERNIICVDRGVLVTLPDGMQDVLHPELQTTGPAKYDITKGVERWLHEGQQNGGAVKGQVIYEHLLANHLLETCLGLADLLAIRAKGINFFRRHFADLYVFGWRSVVCHRGDLYAPALGQSGDGVILSWRWFGDKLGSSHPALRFR